MDRYMEKRVWQRVYGGTAQSPGQRKALNCALRRSEENRRLYESRASDPVYGQAFAHLAGQMQEHCAMLRQILED